MEENFNPVAQTRANYYTPGSPVQFVCVELLRGDVSGEHAVCLTFKNISRVTLTALEIHFKCKGVDGVILCEDNFEYRGLNIQPGESFGMDDAVFVTPKSITSVDVSLKNVYNGKRVVHLESIRRVRLPAPKRLSPELQTALEARMDRQGLKYLPQVLDNGWYCACGAFHPKEEDTVYCSECGSDRILLQNALNTLLQPKEPDPVPAQEAPAVPQPADGSTRVVGAVPSPMQKAVRTDRPLSEEDTRVVRPQIDEEDTRVIPPQSDGFGLSSGSAPAMRSFQEEGSAEHTRVLDSSVRAEFAGSASDPQPGSSTRAAPSVPRQEPRDERYEDAYDEEEDSRDTAAEALIRWVPPLTAILCAGIALSGFVYYQFFL
ncbi:MAG: hypothetical protein ACI4JC_03230 [Faecalibacterium sp.]